MLGKIKISGKDTVIADPNKINLVEQVSCKEIIRYGRNNIKIVLIDCGVKQNIIKCLLKRGAEVIRVPWDYNPLELDEDFDAIFISNGPGDPEQCKATIKNIKDIINSKNDIPILGICLGNQILALASGAQTYKLKYGHRGQNQPCMDTTNRRCYITSQNHGFAIEEKSIKPGWINWFRNANDGTVEGIRHSTRPFMSVQFHPEASCGPTDTKFIFDAFIKIIRENQK